MNERDNEAAIVIQRRYRLRLLGKEKFRKKQLERLRRIEYEQKMYVRIQAWWRCVYARILFQDTKLLRQKLREQRKLERAVTRVQTVWRGRMTRKATAVSNPTTESPYFTQRVPLHTANIQLPMEYFVLKINFSLDCGNCAEARAQQKLKPMHVVTWFGSERTRSRKEWKTVLR
jgi:hypothetical protein